MSSPEQTCECGDPRFMHLTSVTYPYSAGCLACPCDEFEPEATPDLTN